jgi:hypothetical protein|tara:strand:- start:150 stop:473 length:324 start_codon:yes stop_codon:yes gene_type:complete
MDEPKPKSRLIPNKDNVKIERAIPAKGSKISSDGFFKDGHSTITMPKDIDVNTPEGDKKAGKFVNEIQTAVDRGKKFTYERDQALKTNIANKGSSKMYKQGWDHIFG